MNRFNHLNPSLKPLVEGCEIPTEKIPEPFLIEVSNEEYDAMFVPVHLPVNVEDFNDKEWKIRRIEKDDQIIRRMMNSSASTVSEDVKENHANT